MVEKTDSSERHSRSIKIRLYPNKSQAEIFNHSFGIDRFVFNRALSLKRNRWEEHKETVHWTEISKMFTLMKKSVEYDFLNIASRSVIEQSLQKMDVAYKNFFNHGRGFPKFKKKATAEESFVLTDPSSVLSDGHIKLPKLGIVRMKGLRKFEGRIKNVTVKRNKSGKYFATFSMEDVEKSARKPSGKEVGIDVNLENFLTDSENIRIENPRFKKAVVDKIKFYQKRLAKLHRKTSSKPDSGLSRNQSREYRKTKLKLAIQFEKISNKKSEFLHKLSHGYVKNHDMIVVEELQIKNMVKNHNLAESISDVSWGEFFRQLEYKSKWYGAEFVKVPPHNTSKACSECGEINEFLKLSDRTWACIGCKAEHVRDYNSAKNILAKAKTGRGTVRKADGEVLTQVALDDVSRKLA